MSLRRSSQLVLLVAGFALLWSTRAQATVAEAMGIAELVRCADVIVDARVVASDVRMRRARGQLMPFTFHRLAPLAVLHGVKRGELVEMVPGGASKAGAVTLSGAPQYRRGERVLAFLAESRDKPGVFRTCGLAQGKFHVDERAMPLTATRDLEGLALLSRTDGVAATERGEASWKLDALLERVRKLVRAR